MTHAPQGRVRHDKSRIAHTSAHTRAADPLSAEGDRAAIDGGFSFAFAALLLGLGLLAVLDRIGMPDEMLRTGVFVLILGGLSVIGVRMRTMRPAEFYVAGRRLPAAYGGLIFAGAAFALLLPFLPPLRAGDSFNAIAIGFCFGFLLLLFGTGPLLRRSGAYSVADLIIRRFPRLAVRGPVALIVALCAAGVALGGYAMALRGLDAALGLERSVSVALLGGLIVLFVVPGGLSGTIWILASAAVIMVAALLLPLGLDVLHGLPVASPLFGDQMLWVETLGDFAKLTGTGTAGGFDLSLVLACGLGLALLAPLAGAAIASRDEVAALRGGLGGTAWLIVGALLIAATLAGATLALKTGIDGRAAGELRAGVFDASSRGAIAICGQHPRDAAQVEAACGAKLQNGALRLQDVRTRGDRLIAALPMLRGAEPTLERFAATVLVVLGLGLAAAAVQAFVTSLAHDFLAPPRRQFGPASQRLAVARALAIGLVVAEGVWLANGGEAEPRRLFSLALMLSAAFIAPLFALALLPKTATAGAVAALGVAAFVTGHFLFFDPGYFLAPAVPLRDFAANTVFAAFDALTLGLFVTLLPKLPWPGAASPAASRAAPQPDESERPPPAAG